MDFDDDESDSTSPRARFIELRGNIRTMLDLLQQILVTTNNADATCRFSSIDALLDETRYTRFRIRLAHQILGSDLPTDLGKLSVVQKRLIQANIIRRNRVEQLLQRYSMPISQRQSGKQADPIINVNNGLGDTQQQAQLRQQLKPMLPSPSDAPPPESSVNTDTSGTIRTHESEPTDEPREFATREYQSVATGNTRGAMLEHPARLQDIQGSFCKCPDCCSILPLESRVKMSWT